ncbi:basement membrane-specific heparan sulfate proteoglycan core protein-like isoform X2 [Sitodiplosis mosellana]|uniref:basement membrane-specific heparan sulfate proteoglycan core protein-like isoform X2 n=1 Tax=Sitodiplosis mosellana TaxID=263140 RepID=UPI002443E7EE|nr:basement membrane-specific heparan sulfate proteoglycan core protein-like isoform X2 [Sitodiplosis mosellana]
MWLLQTLLIAFILLKVHALEIDCEDRFDKQGCKTATVSNEGICQNGSFNDKASRPEECINCFCFGASSQCKCANLFIFTLPTPVTSLTVIGVHGPWTGKQSISINNVFDKHDSLATLHGVQMRLTNLPVSGELPYYALPSDYLGNQLKSYGGTFKYDVEYSGRGNSNDAPDVIIKGNEKILVYRSPNPNKEGIRNSISVSFVPGQWHKPDGSLASREEIMMTLAQVENVLIRLQYIDAVQREVELLHIVMNSATVIDQGLGSASLVEECRCPAGYSGLSCESCAPGYTRQENGAWLGRCIRDEEPCQPGNYGDPYRQIPCKPCPCPSTTSGNNFARTCYLGPDGELVCDCNRGYTGRRCEQCAQGFVGNPLLPGGSCSVEQPQVSHCDPRGTLREHSDGRCECKEHVIGARCDQCSSHSFFLSPRWRTGCIQCFCNGLSQTCTSSSLFRDSTVATFAPNRHEFALITHFENPQESDLEISSYNNEVLIQNLASDPDVYFWRLPSRFVGNKITSYGGNLNYTIRFVPTPGEIMSRNNAPDVVICSLNDLTILHYRRDEIAPSISQPYVVPLLEENWQRIDGNTIDREYLLMTLADVLDIFIKATYTTTTDEAALSSVILDTTSIYYTENSTRASEIEQCACPQGHQGISCEDCARGYTRSDNGLYLGVCLPCDCNGHSDECDAETGVCHNCGDNTEGDHCEVPRQEHRPNQSKYSQIPDVPWYQTTYFTIGLVILIFILAVCLVLCAWAVYRHRKRLKKAGLSNFVDGNLDGFNPELALDVQADLLPYDKKYEFPRDKLKFGKELGAGAFGVVKEATAQGIIPGEEETRVAVKMVKNIASNEVMRALLSELKIMVHLGRHLNVVNLLGAVTKDITKFNLMVIVEYCPFGSLHSVLVKNRRYFVDQIVPGKDEINTKIAPTVIPTSSKPLSSDRKVNNVDCDLLNNLASVYQSKADNYTSFDVSGGTSMETVRQPETTTIERNSGCVVRVDESTDESTRSVTTKDLLVWSFQIARGMDYLASRKVLHGDLAARNILLCEGNVVKICDFGLARSLCKNENYQMDPDKKTYCLPYNWLALESINDLVFSAHSDAWSFGILMWELFSLGATPYSGMEPYEVKRKLNDGYRLEKAEFATQALHDIMLSCWRLKPETRPTFSDLEQSISKILGNAESDHYVDLNEPYVEANESRFNSGDTDYLAMLGSPNCQAPSVPVNVLREKYFPFLAKSPDDTLTAINGLYVESDTPKSNKKNHNNSETSIQLQSFKPIN